MHYVYVLRSTRDGKYYTGYTTNLEKRLSEHNAGNVFSTKNRRPLELMYYEACRHKEDALRRERYLKTAYGKRYIKNRIKGELGV